ncbi:MAG TPA: hypothetical protein VMU15_20490 [Anaeromyxobacter sp.]|nr:hypothetical protein [Anaeromyxobacter sp.]
MLPVLRQGGTPAQEPTALSCLRCQLGGRRRLLCSKVDQCKALPQSFLLGPLLLLSWAVLVGAFVFAVR